MQLFNGVNFDFVTSSLPSKMWSVTPNYSLNNVQTIENSVSDTENHVLIVVYM